MKFSDQIRREIRRSGMTSSEICKRIALDKAVMSKFLGAKCGLSIATLDRLGQLLSLSITADRTTSKRGRKAG